MEKQSLRVPGCRTDHKKISERHFVVCIGTSEIYGLYEGLGNEWPAHLKTLLKNDPEVEVINASVVGLELEDYRPHLEKYVLSFDPDIMIIMINPFKFAVTQERVASQDAVAPLPESKPAPVEDIEGTQPLTLFNLRSLPKMKQAVKQAMPQSILKWYQTRDTEQHILEAERLRLHGQIARDEMEPRHRDTFLAELLHLTDFLLARHITPILSTYPSLINHDNIERHYEIVLDNRKFYVEYSLSGLMDVSLKLNDAIRRVAAEQGFALVGSEKILPRALEYFADNVHYTDAGAGLMAKIMAGYITRHRKDLW